MLVKSGRRAFRVLLCRVKVGDFCDFGEEIPGSVDRGVWGQFPIPTEEKLIRVLGSILGVEIGLPFGRKHGDNGGGASHEIIAHGGELLLLEMEADLALWCLGARFGFVFVVVADEGFERNGDRPAFELIEEFFGDEGSFGDAAGSAATALFGLDQLLAVDIDNVPASGSDVVAIVDHETVAVAVFERGNFKGASHEEDFLFPEGVDRSGAKAMGAEAAVITFCDGVSWNFSVVVSKRALCFFPSRI